MNSTIAELAGIILDGGQLDRPRIEELACAAESDFDDLLYHANRIRQKYFGNRIKICSIVPGRLGGCNQDCAFCAQSVR